MEISLIRHGKSLCVDSAGITCMDFHNWVDEYDRSSVMEETGLPPVTLEKVTSAGIVVTSDLLRAIDSSRLLGAKGGLSDPIFRETELPRVVAKGLRMRASLWAVWSRLLWFCGYAKQCESLSEAKARAEVAAEKLIGFAKEHGSVVLVGHGFFNMLIAKELKKRGWAGPGKPSSKHWSCTSYFSESDT